MLYGGKGKYSLGVLSGARGPGSPAIYTGQTVQHEPPVFGLLIGLMTLQYHSQ